MRNRLLFPGILLLALAAPGVTGCAWRHAPPPEASTAPPPAPAPEPAPAPPAFVPPPPAPAPAPPVSAADKAYADGMTALQEGGYERALEQFAVALREKPGHPEASKGFDEALVALKKSGDAASAQGKTEETGKRWMGTLRYLNHPAAKGRTYPFTRAEVQGQVDRLTAAQMEKGLLNYRKGDIQAAIAAWKLILAYDPENEEAARSIRTASTQLENLKKIPPSNPP
ncbi:MAG: hypothetical protein H6Q84_1701 [Deltaproteobacteria bacterium]|nr:hypothetical protein [Deltaproteobacteria bacterium]